MHDDLILYSCIGLGSQKAHSIRQHDKVSLAIPPYQDWEHIRGLSMAGNAALVHDADKTEHVADLLLFHFPQLRQLINANTAPPWPGLVFARITPSVISILNYELGFGHTDLFEVT
ncbi:pyridoxamine 5'-phosphate oxidase family protein [Janthinobacterium sp. GW458P]|uniref:pyridoxamine 5'-phosphate oxidase family protein n=1 Tax=Janthinobacterium sp. GW458P TaxID=1981504 RepID=UPI00111F5BF1|nr:pyridoxamine 5'-phosphate oxidase family protein [Janthinobacterium sp. GW458P]MBE3024313.1 pyridoxamine 5'-phosphate oxidase family protein [Janthinobacterium sp. GW458P]